VLTTVEEFQFLFLFKKNVWHIRKKIFYLIHNMRFTDDSTPNHEHKPVEHKKINLNEKQIKNTYVGYPTEILGTTRNHEKIICTPNQHEKV
jgi:hypothetical protein